MAGIMHSPHARHEVRLENLLLQYGNAAYGMFWQVVEFLDEVPGHSFSMKDISKRVVMMNEILHGERQIMGFLDVLADVGLIEEGPWRNLKCVVPVPGDLWGWSE